MDSSPETFTKSRPRKAIISSNSDDSDADASLTANAAKPKPNRLRSPSNSSSDEEAENDASRSNAELSIASGKSHDSSAPNSTRRSQSGSEFESGSDATDNEIEVSHSNASGKSHNLSAKIGTHQSGDSGDESEVESDASYNKNAASRSNVSRKSDNSSLPNRTARASSGDSEDELASGSEAAGNAANEASRSDAELSFVVSDDSNDNDNDVSRCFSPRTRQSLGVGRLDLDTDSDTEDEDDDEIIENSISVSRAAVADSTGLEVPESEDDGDGDAAKSTNTTAISPLPQRKSSAFVALHNEESVADFENIHDDVKSSTMLDHRGTRPDASSLAEDQFDISSVSSNDVEIIPNKIDGVVNVSSDEEISTTPKPQRPTRKSVLVQQKITAYTPKGKQLEYVSSQYLADQQKKRWDLQTQLANNKKLLITLQHTLPDNGAALGKRIANLASELATIDTYIETLRVEDTHRVLRAETNANRPAAVELVRDDWSKITAALDAIQPEHTGRVGLNTFNTQKQLTVERLKQMHESLETCPTEDTLAATPKGLRIELMDHQRYALSWMVWRERQKPRGGILADDMGLGKTLSMISLVLLMNQRDDNDDDGATAAAAASGESSDSDAENRNDEDDQRRKSLYHGGTLVVCPASLINQWEGEVTNRVRRNLLNVVVHHGNKRDVRAKYLARHDIVITTYAIVSREHAGRAALFGIKWKRIILDEAHQIRNHKSKMSEACTALRGSRRWSLTGTPIQNKELDIYAQLRFLRCTPFDDLNVYKKWIGNQSAGNQERMNNIVRPMMLRRTKVQLQERGSLQSLPTKEVLTVNVRLDKDEMNVYQRVLTFSKTLFSEFLHQRAERYTELQMLGPNDPGKQRPHERKQEPNQAYDRVHQRVARLHGPMEVKSHQILTFILRLRQICCHPGLIDAMLEDDDGTFDSSSSAHEVDLLEQLNLMNLNDISTGSHPDTDDKPLNQSHELAFSKASSKLLLRTNPVFNTHRASSKFKHALRLITDTVLPANEKAVVVSQWTSVLEMFREHLDAAGVTYVRLNGQVAVKDRNDLVLQFNSKSSAVQVMLLSLTAGGVGLNLIGGNHLLLLDPHWNPQLEAQAQDRVYRVGQTKPVRIYKFLCDETIEQRIKQLQEKKLNMASDMLNGVKYTGGSKLTIDDMRALFEM